MTGFGKFLCGAAVTSLLAFGAHVMGGDGYIDGIEENARAALTVGEHDGIDLNMARDPLARVAVLSGTDDPDARAAIEETVLATPGVASVRWIGDAAEAAEAAEAPSAEAVASCQGEIDAVMEGNSINFASGSAAIDASSGELIDGVAGVMSGCSGMSVAIGGHTDSTGNADANMALSQARAEAVATALVERGVAGESLSTAGFGSTQLKVADDGANAANRRIEFTFSVPSDATVDSEETAEAEAQAEAQAEGGE